MKIPDNVPDNVPDNIPVKIPGKIPDNIPGNIPERHLPRRNGCLATVSLIWIAGATYLCWQNWPTLPLDMSASDAAIRTAFDAAVLRHVLRAILIALSLPSALFALSWFANQVRR